MDLQPEKLVLDQYGEWLDIYRGDRVVRSLGWGAAGDSVSPKGERDPETPPVWRAGWKGRRLVAEGKGPRGGSRVETYELDRDGRTLTLTVRLRRPEDRDPVVMRSRYQRFEGN